MAGSAVRLVPESAFASRLPAFIIALALFFPAGQATEAQSLYKYRGEDGEWIYSDRPPDDEKTAEVRGLDPDPAGRGSAMRSSLDDGHL